MNSYSRGKSFSSWIMSCLLVSTIACSIFSYQLSSIMASYLLEGFPRSCGRENLGGVPELGLGYSPNSVTFWSGML